MKNLRITKIITALIIIIWVPSSFASPSGISARSSSAASRRSSIATPPSVEAPSGIFARSSSFASPSSVKTWSHFGGARTLSIMGVDRRNEIKSYFIIGSNGQNLIILRYCQDGSCRPLGLQGGYSLEMLEKSSEHWKKLSSDEQFKEFSEAWQKNYSLSVRNQVTDFFRKAEKAAE